MWAPLQADAAVLGNNVCVVVMCVVVTYVKRMWAPLQADAVVLACFNTLIKLRPAILRRWMRILRRAPRR